MNVDKIVLKAEDLDGYLSKEDLDDLSRLQEMYKAALPHFAAEDKAAIIRDFDEMGHEMQNICSKHPNLKVYSFDTEEGAHAEASRVIAKLRSVNTAHEEFLYYSQRAYEMLFRLAYTDQHTDKKNHIIVKTPVKDPVQNYAVHKIPDIDHKIENAVMCVMLRGALLPSMIMSKEIEEYSSTGYVTPFALFKINRDDSRHENDMQYILNLRNSFFKLDAAC